MVASLIIVLSAHSSSIQTGPASRSPAENLISSLGFQATETVYSLPKNETYPVNVTYTLPSRFGGEYSHGEGFDADSVGDFTFITVPSGENRASVYRSNKSFEESGSGPQISLSSASNSELTLEYSANQIKQVELDQTGFRFLEEPTVFGSEIQLDSDEGSIFSDDIGLFLHEPSKSLIFQQDNLTLRLSRFSRIYWPKNNENVVELNQSKNYSGQVSKLMVSTKTSSNPQGAVALASKNMNVTVNKTGSSTVVKTDLNNILNVRFSKNTSTALKSAKSLGEGAETGLSTRAKILNFTAARKATDRQLKRFIEVPRSYEYEIDVKNTSLGFEPQGNTRTFYKTQPAKTLINNTISSSTVRVGIWR